MILRSARLNQKSIDQDVIADFRILMDRVSIEKCKKKKIKRAIEVIDYVITHVDKIKKAYKQLNGSFSNFSKAVYDKIEEMIETSEKYLQEGYKIKGSIEKIRYYQRIYEKIYSEYQENSILEDRSKTLTIFIDKKKKKSDHNCQEMKKHIKKFIINQLPLCQDVIEIIKSYCFYDKKTSETIKMVKSIKNHIVMTIDFALVSRKNGFYYQYGDPDEIEDWAFCANEDEIQFQAVNCRFCGNYWSEYSMDWMPNNIVCSCIY